MMETTKARMDTCPHMVDVEEDPRIDKNEWKIKGRLRDRSKIAKSFKSSMESRSMCLSVAKNKSYKESQCLTEDTLHIDDLCNGKIVFPRNGNVKPIILKRSSVGTLNASIKAPVCNSKRRRSTNTLSKSKRALSMNAASSWKIKYNPILKTEALRNSKRLKVCLKKLDDRNANIVSGCVKFKRSGINNLKQETEDKVVSSIDLRTDSNKNDPCINCNTCKERRKSNEFTDIEQFKRILKRLSTTITPLPKKHTPQNSTPNAQISNTSCNQNLKEKSTVLETNEKQDLLLKKEAEDCDSILNRIPFENVGKTRKLPIVTEMIILSTNTISDHVQGTEILGPTNVLLKSSPEFKISNSHNTYTKVNNVELLNIRLKSEEKTADNSVVEVKDSVKKNGANVKPYYNNKEDSSTAKTTACKDRFSTKFSSEYSSIRDNKANALPAPVLPPKDCATTIAVNNKQCSNNVSAATWMNVESSLSSNNALKWRAERGVVDRQKIVRAKEETEKIYTKAEDLYKKLNLAKEKRANSKQSFGNDGTKRIKFDRSICLKNFDRKRETNGVCDNTGSVVASCSAGTVPRRVIVDSSKPAIVAHVPETKPKNEKDILNLVEEKADTSFGRNNKENTDSLQNLWKPSEITLEMAKLPAKHKLVVAGKANCDSETTSADEDTDTDCLSLYADSTLMEEHDSPVISAQPNSRKSLVRSEKPYAMTDKVFNNYYKSTASEFNRAYNTMTASNSQDTSKADRIPVASRLGRPVTKEVAPSTSRIHQTPRNYETTHVPRPEIPMCFRRYCYRYIRTGNCGSEACKYLHNFLPLLTQLYRNGDRCLFELIDTLVLKGFLRFLTNIYKQIVTLHYTNTIFVLKVLKRLYESTVVTNKEAEWTFLVWESTNISMEKVVNTLTGIVDHSDSNFVNWILKILHNHIIHHKVHGTYWNTLKTLLLKVPNLEAEIITIIVRECVTTQKNVLDVHRNVVIKLDNKVRSAVDQELWLRFNNLLKSTHENNTIKESLPSQSDKHIRSPDLRSPVHEIESALTTSQHSVTIPRKVSTECTPKKQDDNNNAQNESLVLHPIDDLPEPHSPHSRRIFSKFYLDLLSLREGLKDDNYDHVTRILNAAEPTDKTLFSRECYKILCKEVKCSQSRLSKLISFAVQTGATPILYEILFDVSIHILARLAEMELWVFALKLLEDVDIMIKMRIRLQEIDAVTLLLLAEIYLANDQPVQAFTLLKQTNIISTNRNKWETPNNAEDDRIRAQVVALLLDRLCELSLQHAIFLLEFLIKDQSSNFSPVDLARSVNKIVPVVLLEGDHESIINLAKLIDNYNFTLNTITHRAFTASLVQIDKDLAMQFYQNAIGLGIYSNVRFHPATYVIIHSDWTNEEIYLVILDLMQQLSLNIGHAIERIGLQQLSIFVHFETIPSEAQLACDRGADEQNNNRIIKTKNRMAAVLQKEFKPPILFAKIRNKASKLYKLQNTSVRRYLQCEHPR